MVTSFNISGIVISLTLLSAVWLCLKMAHTDLCVRKIRNKHLILLFLTALFFKAFALSPVDILVDFLIGLVAAAVAFGLFAYRKMGAGDVKYIGVSCFLCGLQYVPEFSLLLLASNIILAFYTFSEGFKFTWLIFADFMRIPVLKAMAPERNSIPLGVPISVANVICIVWMM